MLLPGSLWGLAGNQAAVDAAVNSKTSGVSIQSISANLINVSSTVNNGVVTWNDFGGVTNAIGALDAVNFALPSSTSAILNRVIGGGATTIAGTINSNGKVFIVNPNGIVVSSTGTINAPVIGLSTINEPEGYFLVNGNLSYVGTAATAVDVQGAAKLITTTGAESVYLAGKGVNVAGTVSGNLTVDSQGGLVQLGTAALTVGAAPLAGSVTPTGGDITVKSGGGNVDVAQAANVTAYGNVSIDTRGALSNGSVIQSSAASLLSANQLVGTSLNEKSKSITVVAGGNSLTAGNITISNAITNYVSFVGGNVSYQDQGAVQIKNSTVTGNLTVSTLSKNSGGTVTSGQNVTMYTDGSKDADGNTIYNTITMPTAGSVVNTNVGHSGSNATLNIVGDVTTGGLNTAPGFGIGLGTANITATGNIVIGSSVDIPTLVLKSINGNISQAAGTYIDNTFTGRGTALTATANGATSTITLANYAAAVVGPPAVAAKANNFNTVSLNGAAGGATISDLTGLTLSGTVNGAVTVTANLSGNANYTVRGATSSSNRLSSLNLPNLWTAVGAAAPTLTVTPGGTAAAPTTAATLTQTTDINTGKNTWSIGSGALGGAGYTVSTPTAGAAAYYTVSVTGATEGVTLSGLKAASTLTVDSGNGPIVDGSANSIYGALTLSTKGMPIMLLNAGNQLGQVNANTTGVVAGVSTAPAGAMVQLVESTTLNLGTINTGTAAYVAPTAATPELGSYLKVTSKTGNIVNTGQLIVGGRVIAGAGTAVAPGDINLDYSNATVGLGNQITGELVIQDSVTDLFGAAPNLTGVTGDYLAKNVTIVNEKNIGIAEILNTSGQGLTGDLTVTAANSLVAGVVTPANLNLGNILVVNGKLSLSAAGSVTANNSSNKIANVSVTAGDDVDVRSSGNMTVTGFNFTENTSGTVSTALFQTNGGNISIAGANNSTFGGLITFQAGSGSTYRNVNDASGATMNIFGPVRFNATDSVTIDNLGHNFGGIRVSTGNGKSATIVENGTMKVIDINVSGKGNLTLTSTTGDIITAPTATAAVDGITWAGIRVGANAGENGLGLNTVTFNAPMGAVKIDDAGNKNDFNLHKVAISSLTASNVVQAGDNLVLGNVTVKEGGLTLNTSGAANNSILQASGTKANVYGDVTLKTSGTGSITLDNTGNRFGGLVVDTVNSAVTIRENSTLNLKHLATGTGAVALTSESGDIIDSVDANLALLVPAVTNTVVTTGVTTLNAPKGNIELDLAGSDYGVVTLTASGNAKVVDDDATAGVSINGLTLGGGSSVAGTLEATALKGNLMDNGPITVAGNTTFTSSSGDILVLDNNNRFGAIRFSGKNVTIVENTTLNLRGGSIATGMVNLTTFGDFVTSGVGGSSFTYQPPLGTSGGLTINATGTIKPAAGSLLVIGDFTVNSPSAKDLSQLSLSGNLVNKNPINLGTGAYTPPSP